MVGWRHPIVIAGTPRSAIPLINYKIASGGSSETGWSKRYYSANGADASELIASLSPWKINENLFFSLGYHNGSWNSGTWGYTNDDVVSSSGASESSIVVSALDVGEAVLGAIYTLACSVSDTQSVTVASLVMTDNSYDLGFSLVGSDGGYSGGANAILVYSSWTSSKSTTGDAPVVGGSSSVNTYGYVSQVVG